MKSPIRVLTDSTSDIPTELAERWHITVVPAYVQINNHSYRDDGAGVDREQFYHQLPQFPMCPTTSTAPLHEFSTAYQALLAKAEHVIAIVVSSTLSSMYNIARLSARNIAPGRVHVVDSGQVSMGLGWMVIAAAEAAARGESLRQILALLEEMKSRVHVYAALDSLEYLRRSGRVNWARAKAAQILHIKPILKVFRGQVEEVSRTHTRHQAIERLIQLAQAFAPLERLAMLHTFAPGLEWFRQKLTGTFSFDQIPTVAVTTVIGSHVGPQALGLATVTAR